MNKAGVEKRYLAGLINRRQRVQFPSLLEDRIVFLTSFFDAGFPPGGVFRASPPVFYPGGFFVGVTQLVEYLPSKQIVAGSIPAARFFQFFTKEKI